MKIDFICRGNTFRSRLAEAYFNSLNIMDCKACSSGIEAQRNLSGPICWYTKDILEKNKIDSFAKEHWTQTSKKELNENDLIIFMDKNCYDFCNIYFKDILIEKPHKVWFINDVTDVLNNEELKNEKLVIKATNEIYKDIKNAIDNLTFTG